MSDATAAVDAGEHEGTGTEGESHEVKTFTQEDVDKIVADRLKRERGKFEKDAAAAADKARLATLSESEKAIEEAKQAARKETRLEFSTKLAAARIKSELTGLVDDPDAVIEDLNLSRYVTEDGDVDEEAVGRTKEKYGKLLGNRTKQRTVAQPGRSTSVKGTSARDDFAAMLQGTL